MRIENHLSMDFCIAQPYDSVNKYRQTLIHGTPIAIKQSNGEFVGLLCLRDIIKKPHNLVIDCLEAKPSVGYFDEALSTLLFMSTYNYDFLPVLRDSHFVGIASRKKLIFDLLQVEKAIDSNEKKILDLRKEISVKNKVLSVIGHDVKNLFMQVLGSLELLNKNTALQEPKIKTYINMARHSADQIYRLFEEMLLWTRLDAGQLLFKKQWLNVEEFVGQLITHLKISLESKQLSLINEIPERTYIYADVHMLKCILLNVISNAIKYTRNNGTIVIKARQTNSHTIIEISDNGIGMNLTQKEELLNGVSNSSKGTINETGSGLGMIVSKDFIERHNGSLDITTELGKGTSFLLKFPGETKAETIEH